MSLLPFLHRVAAGEHLTPEDARQAMSVLLEGEASEPLVAAFLVALKMKGETADELAGFARAMRERVIPVDAGDEVIDTCGTGAGSAEVMQALGVRFAMTPDEAARAVREIGLAFLFAPNLHPAMKYAQPVRRELKMRTVFNLLGPLANPARAQVQVIGAPSPGAAQIMAEALARLGTRRSFIVHGHDGLDEISTTAPTDVYDVCGARGWRI